VDSRRRFNARLFRVDDLRKITNKAKTKDQNKMTKKTLIALADAIRDMKQRHPTLSTAQLESLADFCQSQNPRFNRQRWLAYIRGECGPNGGKVK
jgi:hypothetical protein